ncbi:DNA polymerase delta subunit 3 [Anopheles cruzii]|uniref:DNA polymerase delta subunit 3 n=1 Tax=Anopheles cruzii TaxID=68878 RepID=UPI0022EC4885|nr:DNA polymerase delta subunit 3 [Anopheles cruzii]
MDAELLKTCDREIAQLVYDANEKVTVRRISNTWHIDCRQSVEILQQWIDAQSGKSKLSQEYILRGVDPNGNVFMTLANEEKSAKITQKYHGCSKTLYSVEVHSEVRPLNVTADREFAVIKLRLEPEKRQLDQRPPPAALPTQSAVSVKQDKKPASNMFAKVKPNVAEVKEAKSSPPSVAIKAEPKTSPPTATKTSPKKPSPKKDQTRKPATGKGAISSFFAAKPPQAAASKPAVDVAVKQESEASTEATHSKSTTANGDSVPQQKQEHSRKRTIPDDDEDEDGEAIPNTPQEDKRVAKKKRQSKPVLQRQKQTNPSKKSRIFKLCDSSSDDEETDGGAERRKERLVDFEDVTDEQPMEVQEEQKQKSVSPEKPTENDSNSANSTRAKVKKPVIKTYLQDGYMVTIKEFEMVSDDECLPVLDEAGKPTVNGKETPNGNAHAVPPETKETPPTPKTKQGSIKNFFVKK